MGGFPDRPDLASFGPKLVNAKHVGNPSEEATAEQFNLMRYQLAGLGLLAFRALLIFTANSGAQPILRRAEAWNPTGLSTGPYAPPTITRNSTGNYDVVYPASVPNDQEVMTPLAFLFAQGMVVTPSQTTQRVVMVTPLSGTPSGVKVKVFDSNSDGIDGHNVAILIG